MEISGKVAIVTGAGSGIGEAIAHRIAREGARVVVADVQSADASRVADAINADLPGRAVGVGGDACDEDVLRVQIVCAEDEFGPVDIFFANAGVAAGVGLDSTEEQWALAMNVNVMAHVRAARLLIPGWLGRGSGYFVTTASAAGLLTQLGSAPYAVSKHAAVGFAEWLSVTYGDRGIGVSCLCPMGVNTPLLNSGFDRGEANGALAAKSVTTAGAVLEPVDVADRVVEGVAAEQFLILPHPEVLDLYRRKGADYERWLAGMRRYQATLTTS
jgi:NAD(P)-dependent dehydrogenase (short-subunit alcohol dehydrogenase family)